MASSEPFGTRSGSLPVSFQDFPAVLPESLTPLAPFFWEDLGELPPEAVVVFTGVIIELFLFIVGILELFVIVSFLLLFVSVFDIVLLAWTVLLSDVFVGFATTQAGTLDSV